MIGFQPGLLDKLFDDDRRGATSPMLRHYSLDEVKGVVARDLEALLNTRMVFGDDVLKGFPECRRSVMTYGLSDFSGLSLSSYYDRQFICTSLAHAISRHEPRLKNAAVTLELEGQASTGVLHLRISAVLTLAEVTEPVSFNALLQPTTLQYAVTRGVAKARDRQ